MTEDVLWCDRIGWTKTIGKLKEEKSRTNRTNNLKTCRDYQLTNLIKMHSPMQTYKLQLRPMQTQTNVGFAPVTNFLYLLHYIVMDF